MKSRTMEGGYVAEGGQLKAVNGQKYIFNDQKEGYFITKLCAYLIGLGVLAAMIITFLITYFLLVPTCSTNSHAIDNRDNETIHHAGLIFNGNNNNGIQNDQFITESVIATTKATLVESPKDPPLTESASSTSISTSTTTTTTTTTTVAPTKKKFTTRLPHTTLILPDDIDESIQEFDVDVLNSDKLELNEGWTPSKYTIMIEPNFETSKNNGTIEIDMVNDPLADTIQPIMLDITEISIHNPEIYEILENGNTAPIYEFIHFYGPHRQTYVFKFNDDFIANYEGKKMVLKLKMDFKSQLTNTLQGFYKVNYYDDLLKNNTWLASTQFSPIDARRAFPCFDRPDKKAVFSISVVRPVTHKMTISNMPVFRSQYHRLGYIQEDFQDTPKMSTYLVAFIVSNLVQSNVTDQHNIDLPIVNIWTRNEVSDMTGYVHQLTLDTLQYLQKYFGIKFKLPKIDLVAVPDFGFSAMENWGLITFRESAMLIPKDRINNSSAAQTERVASIVAHEISHQWFGNLVTMKWWDDLWLKEGFAVYMSYKVLDELEPSWRVLEAFTISEMQKSMEKDSDKSSHPISFPVKQQTDIRRIFDPISYSKGASIIRMMQSFLGEAAFRAAVTAYLRRFEYSNAVQDDLWDIMTKMGHKFETLPEDMNVKEIMDTWTLQHGYPVISVRREGYNVILTQTPFNIPTTIPNDPRKWYVPITYKTKSLVYANETPSYWMSPKSESIVIPNVIGDMEWLYLNINRTSYYRVNYDYESWRLLSGHYKTLPPIIRGKILDDSLNLARTQLCTYDIPLTFLVRMRDSRDDHLAWAAATKGIEYLHYMLTREPAFENFRAVMRFIGDREYAFVGHDAKPGDSHIELIHRSRIIHHACLYGLDRCIIQAQILYRQWMENQDRQINPNLKDSIYCVTLREGSTQEWNFALKRYKETTNAGEKEIILNALGCTLKPWLLSKYLNMTINPDSGIRKQDGARAFSAVAKNTIGYEIAFDFLVTNIKNITEYFGDGFSTLSKMIDSVTTYMNKDYQLEQFERFARKARKLKLTSIEKSIELAKEQIKNNIYWREHSYHSLANFLERFINDLNLNIY